MSYSRRQLYAMGETFGDSATRKEAGGRIVYGGGGGSSAPAPQATTRVTESGPTVTNRTTANEIPNYLTDASQDLIARGQALTSRPYEAYTGSRVAEFSPDMQTAFGRMRNQGVAGQIGQATGLAGLAGERAMQVGSGLGTFNPYEMGGFTAEKAQQYMNPYMQNVVDIERRKAQEASDQQAAMLSGQAARQGAFGGSGAALQQRALRRDTAQQLADLQTQGMGRAFEQGLSRFGAEEAMREQSRQFGANYGIQGQQLGLEGLRTGLQASGQLGQLGQTQFGQEMDITKGLGTAGDVQRQREQALLDVGYGDYLTAQKYPYEQLAFQQGLISGVPYSTTQRTSEISQPGKQVSQLVEPPKEQPNPASQLIGAGVAAYGASGGGNAKGGLIHSYAGGGGISSLNQPQLAAMADDMSDQQLIALQQDPTQGPVTLGAVAEELLNRDKVRSAGIGQLAATTPPPERTVVAEALGGGISDLGARNLENMDEVTAAGGGIIAFSGETGSSVFRPRRAGESFSEYRQAMFQAELQAQQEKNAEEAAAREAERSSLQQRLAEERGGEIIPSSPFFDRTLLPGVSATTAAPRATSLVPTTKPRTDLRKGMNDPRVGLDGLTPAKAKAEQAAAAAKGKPGTEKPASTRTATKTAAPLSGLSALQAQTAAGLAGLETQVGDINAARTAAAANQLERGKAQEAELGEFGTEQEKRLKAREEGLKGAEDKNFNMALIEAGLAMMSGTSANAFENIGKGALVGTKAYTTGIERIQNRKEKLDDAMTALENAKRSDKRVSQERMERLRANVDNAAVANADAIYKFGKDKLDMTRQDAEFITEMAMEQKKLDTSVKIAGMRDSAEKPFNYQAAYQNYINNNLGKKDIYNKDIPVLSYADYVKKYALKTTDDSSGRRVRQLPE